MSIQRKDLNEAKQAAAKLLETIGVLELEAGWHRFEGGENIATGTPHPEDIFYGGQYAATVKRASMDLSRALSIIRQ